MVVNELGSINEVVLYRTLLLLGWIAEKLNRHVVRDVSKMADERSYLRDNAACVIIEKLRELQEAYDKLGEWATQRETHHDEILNHISSAAEQLKSLIDKKRTKLEEDFEAMFDERIKLIADQRTAIDHQLCDLHTLLVRWA